MLDPRPSGGSARKLLNSTPGTCLSRGDRPKRPPGRQPTGRASRQPKAGQTVLRLGKPSSGWANRPQAGQTVLRLGKPSSGWANRPQAGQTGLRLGKPSSGWAGRRPRRHTGPPTNCARKNPATAASHLRASRPPNSGCRGPAPIRYNGADRPSPGVVSVFLPPCAAHDASKPFLAASEVLVGGGGCRCNRSGGRGVGRAGPSCGGRSGAWSGSGGGCGSGGAPGPPNRPILAPHGPDPGSLCPGGPGA